MVLRNGYLNESDVDCFIDDIFDAHEAELNELKTERDDLESLFDKVMAKWKLSIIEGKSLKKELSEQKEVYKQGVIDGFKESAEGWNWEYPFSCSEDDIQFNEDVVDLVCNKWEKKCE